MRPIIRFVCNCALWTTDGLVVQLYLYLHLLWFCSLSEIEGRTRSRSVRYDTLLRGPIVPESGDPVHPGCNHTDVDAVMTAGDISEESDVDVDVDGSHLIATTAVGIRVQWRVRNSWERKALG